MWRGWVVVDTAKEEGMMGKHTYAVAIEVNAPPYKATTGRELRASCHPPLSVPARPALNITTRDTSRPSHANCIHPAMDPPRMDHATVSSSDPN